MDNLNGALERRMKRLNGLSDPRGPVGIATRGRPMYLSGASTGNKGPVGTGMMSEHQRRKQLGTK